MVTGLTGKTLGGRYEIHKLIGEGGMAEVYSANHQKLDRTVAIKLMHRHLSTDPQFQARFEREAQAIARLKHPHIIQVYDYDYDADLRQYYMVIEYIEGPTLSDRMKRSSVPLTLTDAVQIMEALADAVGYAHAAGMQHRDIKPSNVMLDKGSRVVLTDFGIAKLFHEGAAEHLTASGAMIGTPAYMSPEQSSGSPGDTRSDIYALGILFYQLVTGRLPYEGDSPISVIMKHWQEVPKIPSEINPDVPPGIEAIILRCMAKSPDDRYQTAGAILDDLHHLDQAATNLEQHRTLSMKLITPQTINAGGETSTAVPSRTPLTRQTPDTPTYITDTLTSAPRQTTLLIGVGAAAIIILMVLGALLFSLSGQDEPGGVESGGCTTTFNHPLFVQTSIQELESDTIVLEAGAEVEFLARTNGFYQVRSGDVEGFISREGISLPGGCELE